MYVGDHASKKMKPSALDRAGVNHGTGAHHEQQRAAVNSTSTASQSPSRRSPKSPPRSPSWMRHHRDSPPRTISPSISPTERFPESTLVDRPRPLDKLQVEEYEIRLDDGREFDFDVVMAATAAGVDATSAGTGGARPALPPKPARSSDVYRMMGSGEQTGIRPEDDDESSVLNVASYAAAIASDTAHLTRLSVSPLEFDAGRSLDQTTYSEQTSMSDQHATLADPTPKTIDYQNARRQKGKPPSPSSAGTDWSPISDLSPIMDVSPSVERVEQDRMSSGGICRGLPTSGVRAVPVDSSRRQLPNAPQQSVPALPADVDATHRQPRRTEAATSDVDSGYRTTTPDVIVTEDDGVMMRSSLKRCPNFDNISSISSVVNDVAAPMQDTAAVVVSPASGPRPRTSGTVTPPAGQTAAGDTRTDHMVVSDSQPPSATRLITDSQQIRTQDSARRTTTADTTAASDQRPLKTTSASSASDSAARKQPANVEPGKSNEW